MNTFHFIVKQRQGNTCTEKNSSFYSSAFEHTRSIKAIESLRSVSIYVKINVHYIKVDKIVIVME